MFENFALSYTNAEHQHRSVDVQKMSNFASEVGIAFPPELLEFWQTLGCGYFGERVIYFFGDGAEPSARDSLQEWNTKDYWREVYPVPRNGGPLFFAETCFGDQLGIRLEKNQPVFILFSVDTFDSFQVAHSAKQLFDDVLSDKFTLVDRTRYSASVERFGQLRDGMHYAPLVSPLIGGSGGVDNICLESANVHFRTAIATYKALQQI